MENDRDKMLVKMLLKCVVKEAGGKRGRTAH